MSVIFKCDSENPDTGLNEVMLIVIKISTSLVLFMVIHFQVFRNQRHRAQVFLPSQKREEKNVACENRNGFSLF